MQGCLQLMYNEQLLDEVFVISGIIKVEVRGGPFDFCWGGCRIFRLLDIFFYSSSHAGFFLISMSLHDIF